MKQRLLSLLALLLLIGSVNAQFTPGNLAVLRIGDGTQTLANTGNTVFIDQYTVGGSLVNSVAIPDSGANSLILSGTATAEGYLSRSPGGGYLTFAAYNTTRPYSASVSSSASATVPRGIGMLNAGGAFSMPVSSTTVGTGQSWRSATTDGNNNYWGLVSSGGVRYLGNTAPSASVESTYATVRSLDIVNGNLFFSNTGSTPVPGPGIYMQTGLPTSSQAPTQVISTGASTSPCEFVFNSALTVAYIADDRVISSGGGIQRWDYNGSTWANTYTLGTGTGSTVGARGLAVDFSGANAVVYATTSDSRLISVIDTGAGSGALLLATAPTREIFRGLEFVPVPEPSAAVLLLLGLAAVARKRKS